MEAQQDKNIEWSDEEIYNNLSFEDVSSETNISQPPSKEMQEGKDSTSDSVTNESQPSHDMQEGKDTTSDSGTNLSQPPTQEMQEGRDSTSDSVTNVSQPSHEMQEGSDGTSDSEDNIPLAQAFNLVRKRKLSHCTSEEELDDSDYDETYVPNKKDIISSDSENEQYKLPPRPSRTKKSNIRNTGWKKKSKPIKRKLFRNKCVSTPQLLEKMKAKRRNQSLKRNTKTATAYSPNSIHLKRAMSKSLREKSIKEMIEKYHMKRLDQLLNSNDLKRIPVPADGNCFFVSVLNSTQESKSMEELREQLCCHIIENKEHYLPYLPVDQQQEASDEEKLLLFQKEINIMMQGGNWNMALGDCLPLALANTYNRPIRVFSSKIITPVFDIQPNMVIPDSEVGDFIHLAYLAMIGSEHYNGVTKNQSENEGNNQVNPSQENWSEHTSPQEPEGGKSPNVTPHKRANYQSPKRKLSTRKRPRNPESWKRNVRKQKRSSGDTYTSTRGKSVRRRSIKVSNCQKCMYKCNHNVSEEDRLKIFESYYGMGSYERQSDFIGHMVDCLAPIRSVGKRKISKQFFLPVNGTRIRVCRNFFLKTLDIGKKKVDCTIAKKQLGLNIGEDKRGKQTSANKTDNCTEQNVHAHIQSFPKMESHYVRKTSTKQYLANDLNIRKMYSLYVDTCNKNNQTAVKEHKYREIFCKCYNLSFYKPKKDQCSLCNLYESKKSSGTLDDATEQKYKAHNERKIEARLQKEEDKEKAKRDSNFFVATFDLQAVLTTPCSLVSELYYSRKLCCYNLSIYSLGDSSGICHMWDETQGKRGANEIATCLIKNTSSVCSSSSVKEITYYSDTCGGQNRNQFLASSLLYSLGKNKNLEIINQKFLQSGHSQMECDSIHSTIENAKRKTSVFVPSQWNTVIKLSRRKQPYLVIPLKYTDVLDFKTYGKGNCPNMKVATTGERVNWLKLRWIQVRRSDQNSLFVNYTFNEESFLEIKVQSPTRTRRRPRTQINDMSNAYLSKIPISSQKKKDLLQLCEKGIIPEEFHSYYKNLPALGTQKDRVPSSATDEDTDDTDSE